MFTLDATVVFAENAVRDESGIRMNKLSKVVKLVYVNKRRILSSKGAIVDFVIMIFLTALRWSRFIEPSIG